MSFAKKIAQIVCLSLVVAAATLPAYALRPCGCTYCMSVDPSTLCNDNGPRTCGDWLAVALCPAG